MASTGANKGPVKEWRRDVAGVSYLITTAHDNIDYTFVNDTFARDDMFWARRLPEDALKTTIDASLFLGLYIVRPKMAPPKSADSPSSPRTPSPSLEDDQDYEQIGMARYITDFATTAYLTDVFVDPEHRHRGLSTWLISCCNELVDEMPYMRRVLLFATPSKADFYASNMGLWSVQKEDDHLRVMTKKGRGYD